MSIECGVCRLEESREEESRIESEENIEDKESRERKVCKKRREDRVLAG